MKTSVEKLEYQLVELIEEGHANFEREVASYNREIASSTSDFSSPTRSLAFIKFILCHSLPSVNENGACWTYATLKNSFGTVANQLLDINHEIRDNMALMGKSGKNAPEIQDRIIGHMLSASIAEIGEGEDPLIPAQAVPIIVRGVLYKRATGVNEIIEDMKAGKPVKVSMECEFEDLGFLYDGTLYSHDGSPALAKAWAGGLKAIAGKQISRVLGGVSLNGGAVNFHGAAILVGDRPADPGADVLSAVASRDSMVEIGGEDSANQAEDISVEVATEVLPLTAPTYDGPVEGVTLENLQKGYINQQESISRVEQLLQDVLNSMEVVTHSLHGQRIAKEEVLNDEQVNEDDIGLDPNDDYADPGYGNQGDPSHPLSTREDVLAAAEHFSRVENTMGYTPSQLGMIQERILRAAVKFKLDVPSVLSNEATAVEESQADGAGAATDERPVDGNQEEPTMLTNEEKLAAEAAQAQADAATADEEAKKKLPAFLQKKDDKDADEDDKDDDDDKKKKAKAAEEAAAELASKVEHLTRQNEQLQGQLAELMKADDERKRSDRANARKAEMVASMGPMSDEMACDDHMMAHLNDAPDNTFNQFKACASKIHANAFKKGYEAAIVANNSGSSTHVVAAAQEATTEKPTTEQASAPVIPNTETGSAIVKPMAPVKPESGSSDGNAKPNKFRGVF